MARREGEIERERDTKTAITPSFDLFLFLVASP